MLDPKFIRENSNLIRESLKNRNMDFDISNFLDLDEKRRVFIKEIDDLRSEHNRENKKIPELKKRGENINVKLEELKKLSDKISSKEQDLKDREDKLKVLLLNIPNIPHQSVPVGPDASFNKIVREWGGDKKFDFKPLTHIELAEHLDIIDFSRAAKITGSNFILFKGFGAKLVRVLMNFMLDLHTQKHGYCEVWPPLLVNRDSMISTGQLPKLEEDMYKLNGEDYFLIPTAEVPLTNIHRDEILNEDDLPIYYTAYTPCFRKEAGSYGKDTKGLIRVHQFDKVEMVKFTTPESSWDEHEKLTQDAEEVLQLLGLRYRVVALSTGDLSFAASKCYDLEAWTSGLERWLEVSSCSNFTDFQARRANIKMRRKDGSLTYVHTLNGSGLAFARIIICLLEVYQQKDGSISIPDVLRPYMEK
ncbi:MAG: serine--tRNA ligase [Candidatus Kaelpia imicola]|nr:serine--tRNA ligase [Candidatus Kaelpia imicola]